MNSNFFQELFDVCSTTRPKYQYVDAYVKIERDLTSQAFLITEVCWSVSKIGSVESSEVENSLKELDLKEISEDGYYFLKGLFNVEYDSDDYRSWNYLTDPLIIEFEHQISIEDLETQQKEYDKMTESFDQQTDLDLLFN